MPTASDTGGPDDDHGVDAAFRDASEGIDRSTTRLTKVIDGSYTAADAFEDVLWCTEKSCEWAFAFASCVLKSIEPTRDDIPQPGVVGQRVRATLLPSVATPVTLAAQAFKAIGWPPQFDIRADAVVFDPHPPNLQAGETSFIVTVRAPSLPPEARNRTIIYEGTIVDAATGQVVSDPIRIVKPASTS
jgi:hypothetical protein